MVILVNKPAKTFLKSKFQLWYSEQVAAQLEGLDVDEFESLEIQPMDTNLATVKQDDWWKWWSTLAKTYSLL